MMPTRTLVILLCCLALAACDGSWSLKEFTGKSLMLHATDPKAPAFDAVLDYDTAKGCGRLGGARATQDGTDLALGARGGATDGGDGSCARPYWTMNRGRATEPFTTVKVEDGSEKNQLVMQNLFAPRTVALESAATGRVGDLIGFEFGPATDTLEQIEISFLANGAAAADKVVWFDEYSGRLVLEKNFVRVAVPAQQSAATGKVTFAASPKPGLYACDGFAACKVVGLTVGGEFAFTVTP